MSLFQTAYFVIPENVKHGEELICSYFACRNAGIKFRYCSHCKVPVAKRNFRKRHKHGGEEISRIAGDDSDGDDDMPVKKGIPSQITANHKDNIEADGISSQSGDSNHQDKIDNNGGKRQQHNHQFAESAIPPSRKHPTAEAVTTAKALEPPKADQNNRGAAIGSRIMANSAAVEAAAAALMASDARVSEERQKRWMELLLRRPSTKDGDSMSSWLMEVLAVSDLDTPLKAPGDIKAVPPAAAAAAAAGTSHTVGKEPSSKSKKDRNEAGVSPNLKGRGNAGNRKNDEEGGKSSNPSIIKKKRPASLLKEEKEHKAASSGKESAAQSSSQEKGQQPEFISGSFAAWKERKKQKKQAKPESSSSSSDKKEG